MAESRQELVLVARMRDLASRETQRLGGVIERETRRMEGAWSRVRGAHERVRGTLAGIGAGISRLLPGLGTLAAGLGGAFAIGTGVKNAIEFGQEIGKIGAVADVTGAELEELRGTARDVALEFGGNSTDIARSQLVALTAGIKDARAELALLTRTAQLFAEVTGSTTANAMGAITTAISGFSLEAKDAGRVADTLFRAIQAGFTPEELVSQLGQIIPAATRAGISLEEIIAALSTLRESGFAGRAATSGVRAAMEALVEPTEAARKALNKYGIDVSRARIISDGWATVLGEIVEKLGDDEEALSAVLPGHREMGAIFNLTSTNAATYRNALDDVRRATGQLEEAEARLSSERADQVSDAIGQMRELARVLGSELVSAVAIGGEAIINEFGGLDNVLEKITVTAFLAEQGIRGIARAVKELSGGPVEVDTTQLIRDLHEAERAVLLIERGLEGAFVGGLKDTIAELDKETAKVFRGPFDFGQSEADKLLASLRKGDADREKALARARALRQQEAELVERIAQAQQFGSFGADPLPNLNAGLVRVREEIERAESSVATFDRSIQDALERARTFAEERAATVRLRFEEAGVDLPSWARGGEQAGEAFAEGVRVGASRRAGPGIVPIELFVRQSVEVARQATVTVEPTLTTDLSRLTRDAAKFKEAIDKEIQKLTATPEEQIRIEAEVLFGQIETVAGPASAPNTFLQERAELERTVNEYLRTRLDIISEERALRAEDEFSQVQQRRLQGLEAEVYTIQRNTQVRVDAIERSASLGELEIDQARELVRLTRELAEEETRRATSRAVEDVRTIVLQTEEKDPARSARQRAQISVELAEIERVRVVEQLELLGAEQVEIERVERAYESLITTLQPSAYEGWAAAQRGATDAARAFVDVARNDYALAGGVVAGTLDATRRGFGDFFGAVVTGSQTGSDAFRQFAVDVLGTLASLTAEMAATKALGGLLGGLVGTEAAGPPGTGETQAALVEGSAVLVAAGTTTSAELLAALTEGSALLASAGGSLVAGEASGLAADTVDTATETADTTALVALSTAAAESTAALAALGITAAEPTAALTALGLATAAEATPGVTTLGLAATGAAPALTAVTAAAFEAAIALTAASAAAASSALPIPGAANGAVFGGSLRVTPFASGGIAGGRSDQWQPISSSLARTLSGSGAARGYARGAGKILRTPHLAMVGEGTLPEAVVPLPDGRTIPVSLRFPAVPEQSGDGDQGIADLLARRAAPAPIATSLPRIAEASQPRERPRVSVDLAPTINLTVHGGGGTDAQPGERGGRGLSPGVMRQIRAEITDAIRSGTDAALREAIRGA